MVAAERTVRYVPRAGESWRTPWPMYAALRERDPLHHVEDGDFWVLSRYKDVLAAVRDPARYSSAAGLSFLYDDRKRIGIDEAAPLVMLDPPEHTAFRQLITKGYTPRRVAAVEPDLRAFVRERLDEAAAEPRGCDIVARLLKPLPSFVVGRYLGVDPADRTRFDEWSHGIVDANAQGDPRTATDAVNALFGYFTELVERRRREPADDTVSDLVHLMADDPHGLLKILGFAFTMVAGGNDTTAGLLGGALELLTDHRDQRRALLADASRLPDAVEEFLRLTSPVQCLARTVTGDTTLHGRTIPAGRKVLLLYGAANRDPRAYGPDADRPDIARRGPRHLAFAHGPHHCLGAAAARLSAGVALEEMLARFPDFEVDAAAGTFADGNYVRRYATLPFVAGRPSSGAPRAGG